MKYFGIVRRNKSTRKRDIPRRIPKYFRCAKFSETTKSSQRKFPKLWYKKFATEKRDIPFSHSCNIPATRTFVKHRSVPNALSRWKETKDVWRKFALPPSCSYISSHTRKFLKPRRFLNEFLRYCDSKYFQGKTWYPLLSSIPTFRCQKVLETPKSSERCLL